VLGSEGLAAEADAVKQLGDPPRDGGNLNGARVGSQLIAYGQGEFTLCLSG
jgi:hypothetical protein